MSADDVNSAHTITFSSFALNETAAQGADWMPTEMLDSAPTPAIGLPAMAALLEDSELPSWSVPQFNTFDGMHVGAPSVDALEAIQFDELVDSGSPLDALVEAALPARSSEIAAMPSADPLESIPLIIFLPEPNFADGGAVHADAVQTM